MKKSILFVTILLHCFYTQAQTATDSVKATINAFFEGMKKSDTTLMRSTLTEGVIFQTITQNKEGIIAVRTENVNDFIKYIAKPKDFIADERITFDAVKVDGALASVWTPYKFYLGEKFSHCGANSFQLVKINGTWKIQYLVDTRRRQGCE
jgi:hypothetical protein